MLWQDAKGRVIQERGERFRQLKLEGLVIETLDLDLGPHILDILREERTGAFDHLNGEEHIIARNRLTIMPDRALAQRKVVLCAIGRDTPRIRQIRLGQAARIEFDQPAIDQPVHIPVCRIVPIQHGIQTSHRADQGFGVDPAGRGFGQSNDAHRLLAEQQQSDHYQGNGNDQYLPA